VHYEIHLLPLTWSVLKFQTYDQLGENTLVCIIIHINLVPASSLIFIIDICPSEMLSMHRYHRRVMSVGGEWQWKQLTSYVVITVDFACIHLSFYRYNNNNIWLAPLKIKFARGTHYRVNEHKCTNELNQLKVSDLPPPPALFTMVLWAKLIWCCLAIHDHTPLEIR
jgi:hypothetical protein